MATREETQAMIDRNPYMAYNGLRAADDGTIYVIAAHPLTGSDGKVSNAFITLLLLATAHTLYGNSKPLGGFTIRPLKNKRATIEDRLVATARVIKTKDRGHSYYAWHEIHIRAEVHVNGVLYASGTFKRRRLRGKQ